MTALILTLVVKASLIMAAAGAAAILARRASAAKRHMLLAVSVVALLVLPVLASVLPGLRIPVAAPLPVNRIAAAIDTETTRVTLPIRTVSSAAPAVEPAASPAPETQPLPWAAILLAVYLAGASVLAAKLIIERAAVLRLARQSAEVTDPAWADLLASCARETGVTIRVRLLRSLDRTMPMTFGVIRPAILIPSIADTWTSGRRRAVLLHELSHIARRDCLTQLLARMACALYWPHPGTWLLARRLRVERELACDDLVLSTGAAAPDYAQHLLELAYSLGGYRAPALVLSMARPKQLEGRMLAVLDRSRNRTIPAARLRAAAFAAAALIVVPLAAAEFAVIPDAVTFVAEKGASVAPDPAPSSSPAPAQGSARQTAKRREVQLPGTWDLRATDKPGILQLQLIERRNSWSGFEIRADQLQGFSSLSSNGPVTFSIRRDAGTLNFEGTIRSGVAAGTFDFAPSATFAGELAKRGFERPSNDELYVLARNDIGIAYLDELSRQKYARPSLDELLRAGDHGVDLDYLHEMGGAGYHLGQIDGLIRTRDHGVDLDFVNGLKSHGLAGLSVDELVRARDHGVDPDYIGGMKHAGFDLHDLDNLVRTRDHGVDPDYIGEMKSAGYDLGDVDGLIRARDHGVDATYIREMGAHGFKKVPLDRLIKARDHGVDTHYVSEMKRRGYDLDLDELIDGRDHGVDPDFVAGFGALGYKSLTIDQLIRLRDHGVTPSWAKRQNDRGSRLSVDELIRRRDRRGEN
jgi:beta-lactamase regulating signal transducer with metallopeptidase domain